MAEEKKDIKTIEDVKEKEIETLKEENEKLHKDCEKLKNDNDALFNAYVKTLSKKPGIAEDGENEEGEEEITEEKINECFKKASKEISERIAEKW